VELSINAWAARPHSPKLRNSFAMFDTPKIGK
jgi:hypothetical protein